MIKFAVHYWFESGSEMVAHHVNKFLVSKGHHVRVINQRSHDEYNYEGVEVFPANGNIDAFRWSEIVMSHLDFTQFSILCAHEAQRPIVHFVHNDITYGSIQNASRGNYVVYNSEWIKNKIKYDHESFVLHPPCDKNYYRVNDNSASSEYITLISLNERKGGWLFAKIAEAMPDKKFIGVIGSYDNAGPLKLSQKQIVEMMPPNVTVLPNSPDILSVYRNTRILLMPSDYESWGRTATEAMCNGIPVICTPTEGLKENCGEAAIYVGEPRERSEPGEASVHTGTVEQWVAKIRWLDNPNIYQKYSLLCRARADQFDPTGELENLEKFILNARF